MLPLKQISENPKLLTYPILSDEFGGLFLRPLEKEDLKELTKFLSSLSDETRNFYRLDSYDNKAAAEMIDSIAKYDKIRFVLETSRKEIIGLFEFSLDIPNSIDERYRKYGIKLTSDTDCRIGPCLADKYKGKGVATAVFPKLIEISKKLGQKRIILWGGVFSDNSKAIRYYRRMGFQELGEFQNQDGMKSIDMIYNIS